VVSPPASGAYAGKADYVQVTIRVKIKTFFASIVGVSELTSTVNAVSAGKPAHTEPIVLGNAIVSLAQTGCAVFWSHGNSDTLIEGSGVFDNSSDPNCAMQQNGSGQVTAPSFNVVGGATFSPGHVNGPILDATQMPYPPNINWPDFSGKCGSPAARQGSTISPGAYSGHFPPNGVDTLQPGVYCISGDFRVQGGQSLTGHGVTFYMQSGELTWNGGATINLDAQTTGDYAGLLVYQPLSNTSAMTLNGNGDSHYTGTFLAPSANIDIAGTGAVDGGFHSQVVGYTVEVSGTSNTHIVYNDNENYDATIPPAIELSQ
jgi:hypothetical protein